MEVVEGLDYVVLVAEQQDSNRVLGGLDSTFVLTLQDFSGR